MLDGFADRADREFSVAANLEFARAVLGSLPVSDEDWRLVVYEGDEGDPELVLRHRLEDLGRFDGLAMRVREGAEERLEQTVFSLLHTLLLFDAKVYREENQAPRSPSFTFPPMVLKVRRKENQSPPSPLSPLYILATGWESTQGRKKTDPNPLFDSNPLPYFTSPSRAAQPLRPLR
jgi:hypothetical protein